MNQFSRHHLGLQSLPVEGDYLILQDTSVYRDFAEYPRLSIFLPGSQKGYSLPFSPSESNVYHNTSLGGSLPDGIYTARYAVVPHDQVNLCYFFLRTRKLDCQIQDWIDSIDWINEPTESGSFNTLSRLTALRQAMEAAMTKQDLVKARKYYQQASQFVPKPLHD